MRQIALGLLITAAFAATASAQEPATPSLRSALRGVTFSTSALTATAAQAAPADKKKVTVTVGADVPNTYFFRGYRQETDPAFTFEPLVDVGVATDSGATVNFGLWNSFHTGSLKDAIGSSYYETDFYASVTKGMFKALYTAYTYPKIDSSAIQELMFSATYDDSKMKVPMAPTVGVAFELQKSSGADKGVYLEAGVTPAIPMKDDAKVSVSIPVKLGFSLKDYYGGDAMGYFSAGVLVGVPVNDRCEVHFSGTGYAFPADATKFANNGDSGAFVVSGGLTYKF
jgi:hypothetical protein